MHETYKPVKPIVGGHSGGPRRVAVIGRAGAGKTTIARALGEELDLPVVHLDRLNWGPGWRPIGRAAFEARQAEAVAGDAWVIDGGYLSSDGWPERMRRAELVLLVEAPLLVCVARILGRSLARGRGRRRDLPEGCEDRPSLAFIGWTLLWRWRTRRAFRALASAPGVRVIRIRPEGVDHGDARRPLRTG
jgi:adenylate kinase family enzyme